MEVRSGFGRSRLVPPQSGQLAPPTLAGSRWSQDHVGPPAPVQTFEVCGTACVKARIEAGRLVFCGVSVLTFDSKSRRATSGLDKTPGCGWEEWQGLAGGACKRDGREEIVDGEAATDSGGIHPGVEKASSSGAGVLGRGRHVSLRNRVESGLGLGPGQVVAKVPACRGRGRQGRQKLAPIPHTAAQ